MATSFWNLRLIHITYQKRAMKVNQHASNQPTNQPGDHGTKQIILNQTTKQGSIFSKHCRGLKFRLTSEDQEQSRRK